MDETVLHLKGRKEERSARGIYVVYSYSCKGPTYRNKRRPNAFSQEKFDGRTELTTHTHTHTHIPYCVLKAVRL